MIVYILSSLIKKTKYFYRKEKKISVKECTEPLLWDANYDRENNDYTSALRPGRFKWWIFHKFHILFFMLDIFYLSNFFPSII